MDPLFLSRLQFAFAAFFHFLFVPLTLGLSWFVAGLETAYVRTGNPEFKRMARFWGRLFAINFVIGIVTGITLEFQFGTNWARYAAFVGDVFGSLLAIEATSAFFLESTFLAIWIFGWTKVSPAMHLASFWIVTIAAHVSAFWILAANSFMQHPVGYAIRNGRAELTDFFALITQPYLFHQLIHTLSGAVLVGAFFVLGVSAWHLMRANETAFFRRSFRLAAYLALFFSIVEVVQGHMNGALVAEHQPAKLAAMESLWESGSRVPQTVLLLPNESEETNFFELIKLPGALSLLAYHRLNAPVRGLKSWPAEERPPVLLSFLSFRAMVGLGFLFPVLAALGVLLGSRESALARLPGAGPIISYFDRFPGLLWIFVLAIPLPYVAIACGWCLTEVGRQPWLVYGVMKTAEGVSEIGGGQVLASLLGFLLLYSALGAADFVLLTRAARRGPEPAQGGMNA